MNTPSNGPGGPSRDSGPQSRAGSSGSGGEELKDKARHLADDAREEGKARANQARGAAADSLDKLADGARAAATELEDDDAGQLSHYVADAAERMSALSGSLRDKSVDELMGDLTRFAREQPAMFLSGSVAIGFGLARFARASGSRRPSGTSGTPRTAGEARPGGFTTSAAQAPRAGSSTGTVTPSAGGYAAASRPQPGTSPGAGNLPGGSSHTPGGLP